MDEKVSVNIALSLLKSGYELYSIIDNIKYSFKYYSSLIHIHSQNIYLKIDEYQFLDSYKDNNFFYEENIEEIDLLKDKEYYSWRK